MSNRVLFVDDEVNVLLAVQRTLRGHFDAVTCEDPKRALEMLRSEEPFAVLVSDMRMPGMNGIELLAAAREAAPDTVRVMLTGNADQRTAIDAVNKGEIFRFLSKPTDPDVLRSVLALAVRQFELVTAERELLEKTLNGSVNVLATMLSIVKPEAFGRTDRLRAKARDLAARMGKTVDWELETALSLALLGCVSIDSGLLDKVLKNTPLSADERRAYAAHPERAAELLANIPRMRNVADIVLYQHKQYDGSGFPHDDRKGADIPLGARILHLVLAYDELRSQGWSDASIYDKLRREERRFDPQLLEALGASVESAEVRKTLRLPIKDVREGMTIEEDVRAKTGTLLVCNGQVVTAAVRQHLARFRDAGLVGPDVLVGLH